MNHLFNTCRRTPIPTFIFSFLIICLSSCSSSVRQIGNVGAQKLEIYAVSSGDFLSANRTIIILNKKGDVVAYTGGTVTGAGVVGLEAIGTVATAGSILYGAKAIQTGLQNSNINVKGIPSKVNIKTDSTINLDTK